MLTYTEIIEIEIQTQHIDFGDEINESLRNSAKFIVDTLIQEIGIDFVSDMYMRLKVKYNL